MDYFSDDSSLLSPKEIALRKEYVRQYLIDFDSFKACLRLGFNASVAIEWSNKLNNDPYVAKLLAEEGLKSPNDEKTQDERDRQLVLRTLREAAQNGPFASRVQAARGLASILGLDAPVKIDGSNKGGVMVVPGLADITEWEKQAIANQEDLVQSTKH